MKSDQGLLRGYWWQWIAGILVLSLISIACSSDEIQVDKYDIIVQISEDTDGTFHVSLDTDMSGGLGDDQTFTITAKRMYRTNGAVIDYVDQLHAVFSAMEVPLRDLKAGMTLTAWEDKDFEIGHRPSKLSYASLNREIWRRAGINHRLGHPWTSIEILPEFCVSVWPELERPDQLEGDAVFVHINQLNGEKTTKILQAHVRECVQFGGL